MSAVAYKATEARARFSELLARARAGEEFLITKGGKPQARIVPIPEIPEHATKTCSGAGPGAPLNGTSTCFGNRPQPDFEANVLLVSAVSI